MELGRRVWVCVCVLVCACVCVYDQVNNELIQKLYQIILPGQYLVLHI